VVALQDNPFISIVLPTYNRPVILRDCLASVIGQSYRNLEVIVIDDCSARPVEQAIRNLIEKDERIKVYRNLLRRNLPASKNIGISIARYDLILIMEDDMILDRDALRILIDAYLTVNRKDPRFGAMAPSIPRVYEKDPAVLDTLKDRLANESLPLGSTPVRVSAFTGEIFRDFTPKYRHLQEVPDVHACSLFPKSALTEIGGYRERLYKGNFSREESDLTARLKKQGYHFYFEPAAIFYHVYVAEGGCRTSYLEFTYYTIRNHAVFLFYNRGLAKMLYMAPMFVLYSLKGGVMRLFRKLSGR
jgi:glycosyltransferase involved in cell wall biosynthesis